MVWIGTRRIEHVLYLRLQGKHECDGKTADTLGNFEEPVWEIEPVIGEEHPSSYSVSPTLASLHVQHATGPHGYGAKLRSISHPQTCVDQQPASEYWVLDRAAQ